MYVANTTGSILHSPCIHPDKYHITTRIHAECGGEGVNIDSGAKICIKLLSLFLIPTEAEGEMKWDAAAQMRRQSRGKTHCSVWV